MIVIGCRVNILRTQGIIVALLGIAFAALGNVVTITTTTTTAAKPTTIDDAVTTNNTTTNTNAITTTTASTTKPVTTSTTDITTNTVAENISSTIRDDPKQQQQQQQQSPPPNQQQQQQRWNWNPDNVHPCNIRRYTHTEWQQTRLVASSSSSSSPTSPSFTSTLVGSKRQRQRGNDETIHNNNNNDDYYEDHDWYATPAVGMVPSLYHEPIIIQQDRRINEPFRYRTHRDRIVQQFHTNSTTTTTTTTTNTTTNQFTVTLSSSNAVSEHRTQMTLQDYIDTSWDRAETFPDQLSNESWYLFGETYTSEWHTALLQYYTLPPCISCTSHDAVSLSFGIGHVGSGVQWHVHGPGFSEAVHGRKHWILHPPTTSTIMNQRTTDKTSAGSIPIDQYHKDQSSRNWMEYVYPFLANSTSATTTMKQTKTKNNSIDRRRQQQRYYECTLDPGDIIYFPNHWWHATINLDRYTAFISTFTNEHGSTSTSSNITSRSTSNGRSNNDNHGTTCDTLDNTSGLKNNNDHHDDDETSDWTR